MTRPIHLRLVRPERETIRSRSAPDRRDLALVATLFAVNLVPLAGDVATHGRWGAGTTGLATAGALLTGRELWHQVRDLARGRRP